MKVEENMITVTLDDNGIVSMCSGRSAVAITCTTVENNICHAHIEIHNATLEEMSTMIITLLKTVEDAGGEEIVTFCINQYIRNIKG